MSILTRLTEVVEALSLGGIPAYLDGRGINPPCAWIAAEHLTHSTLASTSDDMTLQADIYLVARDTGIVNALATLDEQLGRCLALLAGIGVTPTGVDVGSSLTPPGSAPLPAFKISVTL